MIAVWINTRDDEVEREILDRIDAVLSEFTDGRARWGYLQNDSHRNYEYDEDPA